MSISPFFLNLRSAYRSEMDDLSFDSDGRDVLARRLNEKRGELSFLVQMMQLSPEMVAVIFHQGFSFRQPAMMDHILTHEAVEVPEWSQLSDGIDLTPWAHELAREVLKADGGEWFLTVAAGLHYMAGKPDSLAVANGSEAPDDAADDHDDTESDAWSADDAGGDARSRDEAAADWLAVHGFERKD